MTTKTRLGAALTGTAAVLLALSGCTDPSDGQAVATPTSSPSSASTGSANPSEPSSAQSLLEQLPLRTSLVSVSNDATGDLRIEERSDGTVWLSITGLSLSRAQEPRVYLSAAPLEDVDGSFRFPDDAGAEIGLLTADRDQELRIADPGSIGGIQSVVILGVGDPGVRRIAAARVAPPGS